MENSTWWVATLQARLRKIFSGNRGARINQVSGSVTPLLWRDVLLFVRRASLLAGEQILKNIRGDASRFLFDPVFRVPSVLAEKRFFSFLRRLARDRRLLIRIATSLPELVAFQWSFTRTLSKKKRPRMPTMSRTRWNAVSCLLSSLRSQTVNAKNIQLLSYWRHSKI